MVLNKYSRFFKRLVPLMEANGGGGTGGTGDGGANPQQNPQPQPSGPAFEFDYEKLASIVSGKQSVTEESVLKGYFKQQGLSQDEMKEAIAAYKEQKAKNTPDVSAMQQQLSQAQNAALQAEVEKEAILLCEEIGVELKTMPYLLKMADMKEVAPDGAIDKEKLKEALSNVLEDIPQLKAQAKKKEETGFKFGAAGGSGAHTEEVSTLKDAISAALRK